MTIGPAPMIRTVLMSMRLGMSTRLHQRNETTEQWCDILRARTGFGMALEAERRGIGELDALVAAVEQRAMGRADVAGQACLVDREAVVLAGDHHLAGGQFLDRVVRAVVPGLHLDRTPARGKAEDLVAQADPEGGNPARQQLARGRDRVVAGGR